MCKSLIYLLLVFSSISLLVKSQTTTPTRIKIQTPFCNNNNNTLYDISTTEEWDEDDIENSISMFLYDGGIFMINSNSEIFGKNFKLRNYDINCLDLENSNIIIGTNNGLLLGVYSSTNDGITWENSIHYLPNKKVLSLKIEQDLWIVGTESNGLAKSTDEGENWTWPQDLQDKTINKIIKINNHFYAATSTGVYKSTNNGDDWSLTGLEKSAKTIYNDNINTIFVSYSNPEYNSQRLRKSTNGGSWENVPLGQGLTNSIITSIFSSDDFLFIGTVSNGFWYYDQINETWHERNKDYPNFYGTIKCTLNDIMIYNNDIYIATQYYEYQTGGVYRRRLSDINSESISWDLVEIKDQEDIQAERRTKQFKIHNGKLFIACKGGNKYPGTEVLDCAFQGQDHAQSQYWGRFQCYAYAWHLSESGLYWLSTNFFNPIEMGYIEDLFIHSKKNWDYLICSNEEKETGFWDKITYDKIHTGIKSFRHPYPDPYVEDDVRVISKWGLYGPLVDHKLNMQPWSGTQKQYWKSKKIISSTSLNDEDWCDQFVGRQIITDGSIDIPDNKTLSIYVAPMNNHFINLKDGFNYSPSENSNLHVYINNTCQIPWFESEIIPRIVSNDIEIKKTDSISLLDSRLLVKIMPNPSSNEIIYVVKDKLLKKINEIIVYISALNGNLIKKHNTSTDVENHLNLENLTSGVYSIKAVLIESSQSARKPISTEQIFMVIK